MNMCTCTMAGLHLHMYLDPSATCVPCSSCSLRSGPGPPCRACFFGVSHVDESDHRPDMLLLAHRTREVYVKTGLDTGTSSLLQGKLRLSLFLRPGIDDTDEVLAAWTAALKAMPRATLELFLGEDRPGLKWTALLAALQQATAAGCAVTELRLSPYPPGSGFGDGEGQQLGHLLHACAGSAALRSTATTTASTAAASSESSSESSSSSSSSLSCKGLHVQLRLAGTELSAGGLLALMHDAACAGVGRFEMLAVYTHAAPLGLACCTAALVRAGGSAAAAGLLVYGVAPLLKRCMRGRA